MQKARLILSAVIFLMTAFLFLVGQAKAAAPTFTLTRAANGATNKILLIFSENGISGPISWPAINDPDFFTVSGSDGLSITSVHNPSYYDIPLDEDINSEYVVLTMSENVNIGGAGEVTIACAADSIFNSNGAACVQGSTDLNDATVDSQGPSINSISTNDANSNGILELADSITVGFDEPIDTQTMGSSFLTLSNGHDFDEDGNRWNSAIDEFTIYLGSNPTVAYGDTIDPQNTVTDLVGNPDETPAPVEIAFDGSVVIDSPNGGEVWQAGETHNVIWTAENVDNLKIYIYDDRIDGSGSTNYITPSGDAVSAASGSFSWTITQQQLPVPPEGMLPDNYLIRIDGLDADGNVLVSDFSDAVFTINEADPSQVVAPHASPAGGTYESDQSVTLSTSTDGATIYYTTNGSTPTASSTQYSGAIEVDEDKTIKAIAIKEGMTDSAIMVEEYEINKIDKGSNNYKAYKLYKNKYKNNSSLKVYKELKALKKSNPKKFEEMKALYKKYKGWTNKERDAYFWADWKEMFSKYKKYNGYRNYKIYKDKVGL